MVAKNYLNFMKVLGLAVLAFTVFHATAASAEDQDPPSRVARLAYAQGSVSFQPAGTDDWVTAAVNRPMTTGDKLWSDNNGRVEMQLDGSLLRLSNNTGFSFLNLNDKVTQIRLTAGNLLVRVRRLDQDETYEIDTPNLAFSILRTGLYRLTVNDDGDTTVVKVRNGEGEVTGGGTAYNLRSNEFGSFVGTDRLRADLEDLGNDRDDFERWGADRDRHWQQSTSARYVSPDVIGYEDLDDHGAWREVPEYGTIWFPRTTVVGWAPYHYGHWAYIEPWGYTWVDDEPWGFAPFHYGRWVAVGGAWGWVPSRPSIEGVVYVRPVYAPALVAWIGGPRFSVGIGIGGGAVAGASVGWFPLGPREVYVPSYPVSRTYVNNVNVSNTTVNTTVVNNYYNNTVVNRNNNVNVTNVKYVNQSVPGAVAATTPQAFSSAQPVARNAVQVNQREVASAPVRPFTPAAVPVKQAVLGTATAAAAQPPAALQTRAVVAKSTPPPPPPTFERQQQAIRSNGGQPLSVTQAKQIAPAAAQPQAQVRMAPPAVQPVPSQSAPSQNVQSNRPGQPQNGAAINRATQPGQPNGAPQVSPGGPVPANGGQPPIVDRRSGANNGYRPGQPQNNGGNPAAVNATPPAGRPLQPNANGSAPPPSVAQPPVANNAPAPNGGANRPNPQQDRAVPADNVPQQNRRNDRPLNSNNGAPQGGNGNVQRGAAIGAAPGQISRSAPPAAVHPNDLPPIARPVAPSPAAQSQDQQRYQQQEQVRARQDQERQQLQRQQEQDHQRLAQQQSDAASQRRLEQLHQQQTQQLEQQRVQQQQRAQKPEPQGNRNQPNNGNGGEKPAKKE